LIDLTGAGDEFTVRSSATPFCGDVSPALTTSTGAAKAVARRRVALEYDQVGDVCRARV